MQERKKEILRYYKWTKTRDIVHTKCRKSSVLYERCEHALGTVVVHQVGGGAGQTAATAATAAATFQLLGPFPPDGALLGLLLGGTVVRGGLGQRPGPN